MTAIERAKVEPMRSCAFYEVAMKIIAKEERYIVQINARLNIRIRAIPARCKI